MKIIYFKKSNIMSVDLNNKMNISAIDINPHSIFKLKIIKKESQKFNNKSTFDNIKNRRKKQINKINKDLSAFLFQNNEVGMVRSLNPDLDRNICDNLLFKENLKNNAENNNNYDVPDQLFGEKINLPKIKKITITGILESGQKLNQNKKENQRNIANNQLEKELYQELKNIRNKCAEIKKSRNELFNKFGNIMKEINSINLDLHILELRNTDTFLSKIFELKTKELENQRIQREKMEYDNKFNQKIINTLNQKIPNLDEGLNINNINTKMNINNNESEDNKNSKLNKIEDRMKKIKSLYLAKKEQDEMKYEKMQKIKSFKDDIKVIEIEINSLNNELKDLKEKDKNVVQKLMKHFQALLYRGRDTRNEGLIWIIKAMWNLGKNVPMQFIPTFLDFKSIEFLFKYANKTIELENKKKLLINKKKEVNIKLHRLYHFNNINKSGNKEKIVKSNNNNFINGRRRSSLTFKTNLIKNNSVLKKSVSESIFIKSYIYSNADDEEQNEENPNTFKGISMIIDKNKKDYEIEHLPEMNDIENIQMNIKVIEKEIEKLKSEEIKRIFKEFITNDYRNKYHVSVDIVLSALLGEHIKNIEVNKFAKFKREYLESVKNLRFYEYGKHKDSS